MKTDFFLNINSKGSVRATKGKVSLYTDEVSIKMQLEIPDRLFQKPLITGKIKITDEMVRPSEINADVLQELRETISSIEGVELTLLVDRDEIEEVDFENL